jgi:lysozyme family protein
MADFLIADKLTEGNEGRDVWNIIPGDSGGETWSGIARNKNPHFPGWAIIDSMKPLKLGQKITTPELEQLRLQFYKKNYWDVLNGDNIPNQELGNQVYDMAVNSGVGRAEEILKQSMI